MARLTDYLLIVISAHPTDYLLVNERLHLGFLAVPRLRPDETQHVQEHLV